MLEVSATLVERYWSHVERRGAEECWPWTASFAGSQDHGRIYVGKDGVRPVFRYAHRVAWMLANGEDPGPNKVRHRCDNPPCQNPAHLLLGTQADNVADMIARGRDRKTGRPGERHHAARLTAVQIDEIRRLREAGAMQKDLAARFGVCKQQISRIVRGERWNHVKGD